MNRKPATRKEAPPILPAQETKSDLQLEAIFRAHPDLLFYLDPDGTILEYRAGDPTLLYLPPEEFLGRKMQDVLPPEVSREIRSAITETCGTGRITVIKYRLETPRGERWFDARFILSTGARLTVIIRDITEQAQAVERLQRQLTRMASLRSIDAAIMSSFDLKVTLSVILREVINHLKVDAADVLLFDPATRSLEFAAGRGFRSPPILASSGGISQAFAGKAIQERQAVHAAPEDLGSLGLIHSADSAREGFVSYHAVPLLMKGMIKGVLEIHHRSPISCTDDESEFLDSIARHIAIAIEDSSLFNDLQRTNSELVQTYDSLIEGWARAMELRDHAPVGHTLRLAERTVELAQRMGMAEAGLVQVRRGALLHDIGRLADARPGARRPDPFDDDRQDPARGEPGFARELLSSIPYLHPALDIPCCHHECWDGSGYPAGLKEEQIPLAARIFAVVEAWDTLVSLPPVGAGMLPLEARRMLVGAAGARFDPAVVKTFLAMLDREESR